MIYYIFKCDLYVYVQRLKKTFIYLFSTFFIENSYKWHIYEAIKSDRNYS